MTAQTRATNISRFEQGDVPQGTDFADLIDSYVSLADTTAQVLSSDLKANNFSTSGEVSAATISAAIFNISTLSAANVAATNIVVATSARIGGTLEVPASAAFSGVASFTGAVTHTAAATFTSAATFSATVSASSVWVDGLLTLVSGAGASGIVRTTANNPVILSSANQGLTLCRGFTRIRVDGTTAYVPFFYAT